MNRSEGAMSKVAHWMLGVAIRSSYRAALRRNGEMTSEYIAQAAQNEVDLFWAMRNE